MKLDLIAAGLALALPPIVSSAAHGCASPNMRNVLLSSDIYDAAPVPDVAEVRIDRIVSRQIAEATVVSTVKGFKGVGSSGS